MWSLKEGVGMRIAQQVVTDAQGGCQVHRGAPWLSLSATLALGTQSQVAWGNHRGRHWFLRSPGGVSRRKPPSGRLPAGDFEPVVALKVK